MIINYLINILARKSISKRVYRTLVLISVFHRYMISERQELSYFGIEILILNGKFDFVSKIIKSFSRLVKK
ncbi:MAG TPA: hypothetical protein ENF81_07865 [Thermotogaceae bacterium]|nr:hypothetical protein [Thermotogaceae bacterium]